LQRNGCCLQGRSRRSCLLRLFLGNALQHPALFRVVRVVFFVECAPVHLLLFRLRFWSWLFLCLQAVVLLWFTVLVVALQSTGAGTRGWWS
jgi:hypothetical protein